MTLPAYVDEGEGEGEPLLLLMGLGAPGETWRPHIDAWSQSFRCIAIDNRGAGGTPVGAVVPTTRDLAEDAAALVAHLGLGSVRVAGISMGACIAQELTLGHPELVSKAVLVAPWARVDAATDSLLETLWRAHASGDTRLFQALLRNLIWTREWIDEHAEEQDFELNAPLAMATAAFRHQVDACAMHNTLSRLNAITVPVLVTWGARDTFIRPELSVQTAAAISGAQTSEYRTGHVHHWEELDRFNREVEEWLR